MRIIDILIDSAMLLGLNEEAAILRGATNETEAQIVEENTKIESLFHLIKYSIRELCTNYVPVATEAQITTANHQFPLNDLTNYIRINTVTKNGELVKHKVINRNIVLPEDGDYVVEYSTYPEINTLFQEIDFMIDFSSDVITYGLCAYFALSFGLFSEFEEFHEEYTEKAEKLKTLKTFNLPSRRWE